MHKTDAHSLNYQLSALNFQALICYNENINKAFPTDNIEHFDWCRGSALFLKKERLKYVNGR